MSDTDFDVDLSETGRANLAQFKRRTERVINEFSSDNKAVNILICGKTGVGKSTLINAVFNEDLAKTGIGEPITQGIELIVKPPNPIRILDTKGLELKDYTAILNDIIVAITSRKGDDPNEYVHVAWLCISSESARVENAEIALAKKLTELGLKVIVVLTKVRIFSDKEFFEKVKETMANFAAGFVMTRGLAYDEIDDEDEDEEPVIRRRPIKGLDELINLSYSFIPDAQRQAFLNVISGLHKTSHEIREEEAKKFIRKFAANNSLAVSQEMKDNQKNWQACIPPVMSGMLLRICYIYGIDGASSVFSDNIIKDFSKKVSDNLTLRKNKIIEENSKQSIFSVILFGIPNYIYNLFASNTPDQEHIRALLIDQGEKLISNIKSMTKNNEEMTIATVIGKMNTRLNPNKNAIALR